MRCRQTGGDGTVGSKQSGRGGTVGCRQTGGDGTVGSEQSGRGGTVGSNRASTFAFLLLPERKGKESFSSAFISERTGKCHP